MVIRECLAYDDVQLIPLFSKTDSRSDGFVCTKLTKDYELDIPLIASPMDTVCERKMALKMWELGGVGIIHRFMSIEEQVAIVNELHTHTLNSSEKLDDSYENLLHTTYRFKSPVIAAAIGVRGDYLNRAIALLKAGANVLLIDVAHGHDEYVGSALKEFSILKGEYRFNVIGGSVATAAGALGLYKWGADAIRCGIGNGCFVPGTEIRTENGLIKIENIGVGTRVYTHTGELQQVIDKLEFDRNEEIISINNIDCTMNHEFYAIHNSDISKVTEENIHQFAKWISADELDENWCLVELE